MFTQPKTKLQINLENLDRYANQIPEIISYLIQNLNESYWQLWCLPEDELTEVLQHLLNSGKLSEVLTKHNVTGNALNDISVALGG